MTANTKKILIVDDEPDILEVLKAFLEDENYLVFAAANAEQALKLVELERPDLVFQDVMMPSMSGIECLKRIKAINPETIVVMVSGLKDEGTAKEAIRQGAYDYITKPFDLSFLKQAILSRVFYR